MIPLRSSFRLGALVASLLAAQAVACEPPAVDEEETGSTEEEVSSGLKAVRDRWLAIELFTGRDRSKVQKAIDEVVGQAQTLAADWAKNGKENRFIEIPKQDLPGDCVALRKRIMKPDEEEVRFSHDEGDRLTKCIQLHFGAATTILRGAELTTDGDPKTLAERQARWRNIGREVVDEWTTVYGKSARLCQPRSNFCKPANWFPFKIGVAEPLTRAMVLLWNARAMTKGKDENGKDENGKDPKAPFTAVIAHASAVARSPRLMGAEPPTEKTGKSQIWTGTNLVWGLMNHFRLALATGDAKRLRSVSDSLPSALTTKAGKPAGIQPDGSYHFHGAQVYTGGYGSAFAALVASYVYYTGVAPAFALRADALERFARYVERGGMQATYKGVLDPTLHGRQVLNRAGNGHAAAALVLATLSLGDTPPAWQERMRGYVLRMRADRKDDIFTLRGIEAALLPQAMAGNPGWLATNEQAQMPSGHFHYPWSDHSIHRRGDFFASVKMSSNRTRTGEMLDGSGNALGARQSDGRFYLSLDGGELFFTDQKKNMPTIDVLLAQDWKRLPGTTVLQRANTADGCTAGHRVEAGTSRERFVCDASQYGPGAARFTGGVSIEQDGVSAMRLNALGSDLTSSKSWFFFGDDLVFLTSDASCPGCTADPVETVVTQWPIASQTTPVTIATETGRSVRTTFGETELDGVRWMAAADIGYWFPGRPSLRAKNGTEKGCPAAFDDYAIGHRAASECPANKLVQAQFLTAWFEHGKGGANNKLAASFAYVVRPRRSADEMAAFDANPTVAILENNATVSAVDHERAGGADLGVVVWPGAGARTVAWKDHSGKARPIPTVSASRPMIAQLRDRGDTVSVAVSFPTGLTGEAILTLADGFASSNRPSCVSDVRAPKGATEIVFKPMSDVATCRVELSRREVRVIAAEHDDLEMAQAAEATGAEDAPAETEEEDEEGEEKGINAP